MRPSLNFWTPPTGARRGTRDGHPAPCVATGAIHLGRFAAAIAPYGRLQRLDRDLAEFDRALTVLQSERPLGKKPVVQLGRLLAVEHHGDLPSLGRDFVGVPLPPGLGHRVHLDVMDDPAGAVGRVLALVEDIDLVAGPVTDLGRFLAAEEDSAVGVVARPE